MAARTATAEVAARMTVNVAAKVVVTAAATDAMPNYGGWSGSEDGKVLVLVRARAARARAAGAWLKAASRRA